MRPIEPASRSSLSRSAAVLIGSFGLVAVTFTAATVIAQRTSFQIHSAAQEITGNSSASIAQLSAVRSRLRQLELRADHEIDACNYAKCEHPEVLLFLLHDAEERWTAYKNLPSFPRESEHWPKIDGELRVLERELGQVIALTRHGDLSRVERRFEDVIESLFDGIDDDVARLSESEQMEGIAVAERIDRLARRSVVLAGVLDLLSIALTVVAAALALRLVRREERWLRGRADQLDQFAGCVSHELLTPLWVIDAGLHRARRGADPGTLAALDGIGAAVQSMQEIVRALLAFSRGEPSERSSATADVRSVAEATLEQLQPLADQGRVSMVIDDSLTGTVACSEGVLSTVVANLVANGIKHMGASGVRSVRIRGKAAGSARVGLEVEDTGPGIDRTVQERLFEPFVRGRTSAAGFGLGLAIVSRIVSGCGGRIGVMTAAESGTAVWVELPRAESPPVGRAIGERGESTQASASPT